VCGPEDHPETALQAKCRRPCGRPASRALTATSSSLARAGATERTGSRPNSKDRMGHTCGYHGKPQFTTANSHTWCATIDLTNADHRPQPLSEHLDARSLGIAEGQRAAAVAGCGQRPQRRRRPEVDIYRFVGRRREPQLLASVAVGTGNRWRRYRACDWPRGQPGTGRVNDYVRQSRSTSLLRSRYGGSNRAKIGSRYGSHHSNKVSRITTGRRTVCRSVTTAIVDIWCRLDFPRAWLSDGPCRGADQWAADL